MTVALIGQGAIGSWLLERLDPKPIIVKRGDRLPAADLVVEAAGHGALAQYGAQALAQGSDLIVTSIGALADQAVFDALIALAPRGRVIIPSGAVAGVDALCAAKTGGIDSVRYTSRKPPQSLGEDLPTDRETIIFEGNAREAALRYPKNANVAATIALAGVGFEATHVWIVADPAITENMHTIEASGTFGSLFVQVSSRPLPQNPKTSSLAAMSVLSTILTQSSPIVF